MLCIESAWLFRIVECKIENIQLIKNKNNNLWIFFLPVYFYEQKFHSNWNIIFNMTTTRWTRNFSLFKCLGVVGVIICILVIALCLAIFGGIFSPPNNINASAPDDLVKNNSKRKTNLFVVPPKREFFYIVKEKDWKRAFHLNLKPTHKLLK